MNNNLMNEKLAYENAKNTVADSCGQQATPYRPPTLRESAEKSVGYHREQADLADRAASFFRENPAFDEFIRLIRSGAIQF